MLHAGLDLSRKRLDVCLLSEGGQGVEEFAAPPDRDGLQRLARRVGRHALPVRGVVESMTGARFVHDTLDELGWDVAWTRSSLTAQAAWFRSVSVSWASSQVCLTSLGVR